MLTDPGRVPLARRAWVGDGRRGASVAADGTLDWYCPSRLAAEPGLWRLLDADGAAVRVGPVRDGGNARRRLPPASQRYVPGTNVVETVMDGPAGRKVSVVDFMPWPGPGLEAPGAVVRLVRALSGPVDVEVEVVTGPRRGREVSVSPGLVVMGAVEVRAPGVLAPAPLGRDQERWRSVIRLDGGEEVVVTVGARGAGVASSVDGAHQLADRTESAWRSWLATLAYTGPYRAAVERALLSVRVLTGDGGAPAGAGTACLPRRVGSERSGDDRWVRLRDVALGARVLARAGMVEDAEGAETWMRETLGTAHLPWPAWFDADGQPVPEPEDWPFRGWRGAGPVLHGRARRGRDAGLVGDVVEAVGASASGPFGTAGDPGPLSAAWTALAEATDQLADTWTTPDSGRWEIERPERMYVAGRVRTWAALDRMTRLARAANPLDLQAVAWQQEAREVLAWLETRGVAADGGLRMDGGSGSDEADAALLAVAWQGPWPASHPVVTATVERVMERLSSGPLLYRYSDRVADERSGPDNPDMEASLMAVKALAALRRWDAAHERLEGVVALASGGAGLFTETAHPVSGELFGNFPCTAAALALLDAALSLQSGPR